MNVTLEGRSEELALLDDGWKEAAGVPHVIGLIGEGGQGKTVLLHTWLRQLQADGLRGADCVYVHSFYNQGTSGGGSADGFLEAALRFLQVPDPSEGKPADKAMRLASALREHRTLLILDGVEPLQGGSDEDSAARFQDEGIKTLLRELVYGFDGLCIVTSRRGLTDLQGLGDAENAYHEQPILPVSESAGMSIMREQGVAPDAEVAAIVRDFGVHGLSMRLLGVFIAKYLDGDASRRAEVPELESAAGTLEEILQAFDAQLSEAQRCFMRLIGLFPGPAELNVIRCLWEAPVVPGLTEPVLGIEPEARLSLTESLRELGLLWPAQESDNDPNTAIDTHPRIRAYFGERLRAEDEDGWKACHGRLFDHLCEITPHQPDTLEDLMPLYQAVAHGCHAGRHQEVCDDVYRDRISRRAEDYVIRQVGAFGTDLSAVGCFFEQSWKRVSLKLSESAQAWLLGQAGFRLRSLGRLTEALEPMQKGMFIHVAQHVWLEASKGAGNLSEIELTLGQVDAAVADAGKAVRYANLSQDAFEQLDNLTILADAQHQSGERAKAEALFREAEAMQAEGQPTYPKLYSLTGFRYCELILAEAQMTCSELAPLWIETAPDMPLPDHLNDNTRSDSERRRVAALRSCDDAVRRAKQVFEWRKLARWNPAEDSLLNIALDHLTIARAQFYRALLTQSPSSPETRRYADTAVDGLRQAGSMDHVPRGLLTRAWLLSETGDNEAARQDLDEAWQIAESGSMKLHMADCQLLRARLFHDGDALVEAKRLIEECGYHRRDAELKALEDREQ